MFLKYLYWIGGGDASTTFVLIWHMVICDPQMKLSGIRKNYKREIIHIKSFNKKHDNLRVKGLWMNYLGIKSLWILQAPTNAYKRKDQLTLY